MEKNGTANEGNCLYDRENWISRNVKRLRNVEIKPLSLFFEMLCTKQGERVRPMNSQWLGRKGHRKKGQAKRRSQKARSDVRQHLTV